MISIGTILHTHTKETMSFCIQPNRIYNPFGFCLFVCFCWTGTNKIFCNNNIFFPYCHQELSDIFFVDVDVDDDNVDVNNRLLHSPSPSSSSFRFWIFLVNKQQQLTEKKPHFATTFFFKFTHKNCLLCLPLLLLFLENFIWMRFVFLRFSCLKNECV